VVPVHQELAEAARRAAEEAMEAAADLSFRWHGLAEPGFITQFTAQFTTQFAGFTSTILACGCILAR
jgi:hypothetical protein